MPPLLAVCLVVTAAAQVAIAVVAIRALSKCNRATAELERSARALRDCASEVGAAGREVQAFVASLREALDTAH